jgi:hypothetical protein
MSLIRKIKKNAEQMNISHRSSKFGKDKSKLAKDNPHQGTEGW